MNSPAADQQHHRQRDLRRRQRRPESRGRPARPTAAPVWPLSSGIRSGRVLWIAGNSPNSRPVPSASTRGEDQRRRVERERHHVGRVGRQERRHESSVQRATSTPAAAARIASSTTRSAAARISCQRAAPIDSAHRHLAGAARRAREQQVGDVGARDEQHEAGDAQQQHQRRPGLPRDRALAACAPGSTTRSFARNRAIVASLMPFCSGARPR